MRDEFTKQIVSTLAKRVGFRCSNPSCRRQTIGAATGHAGVINVGVAAHISAASPLGPRFDPSLTVQERSHPANGIWLCQLCAKAVDSDSVFYTRETLHLWKTLAESEAFIGVTSPGSADNPSTRICSVPIEGLTATFVGRDTLLKSLRQTFLGYQSSTQVLTAIGGMGKTQTALQYTRQFFSAYQALFWINADDEARFVGDWLEAARLVGIEDTSDRSVHSIWQDLISWLRINEKWLVVVDNYTASAVHKFDKWLVLPPTGHLLVTTRDGDSLRGRFGAPIELGPLEMTESTQFLFERIGRQPLNSDEFQAAQELSTRVGALPLALEQCAARVATDASDYRTYLEELDGEVLASLHRQMPLQGSFHLRDEQSSVETTWKKNISNAMSYDAEGAALLGIVAFLFPEQIPLEWLQIGLSIYRGTEEPVGQLDCVTQMRRSLQYSLIVRDPAAQSVSLHRLVQEAIRQQLTADDTSRFAGLAYRVIEAVSPEDPELPHNRARASVVLPHTMALWNSCGCRFSNTAAVAIYSRGARFAALRAMYGTAEKLFADALAIKGAFSDAPDEEVLTISGRLANLYRYVNRWSEAENLYRSVLAQRVATLGAHHRDVALTYNNLGNLLYDRLEFEAAQEAYLSAMNVWRDLGAAETPDSALTINGLANVYRRLGKWLESEQLYQLAIDLWSFSDDPMAVNLPFALNGLGNLYFEKGILHEADWYYRRALAIWEEQAGRDHPSVAFALNNIGRLEARRNNFASARVAYGRALAVRERKLGGGHNLVAASCEKMADVYESTGDLHEASLFRQRARKIREANEASIATNAP